MRTINIDFEVFKELTARRTSEAVSENDVIRGLLGLDEGQATQSVDGNTSGANARPWVTKRVTFPHGAEFRATYKGQRYLGTVDNGALLVNQQRYTSPSAAAMSITESPVNGWRFWECKLPGTSDWKLITTFRN